jgi:hypothetical protein
VPGSLSPKSFVEELVFNFLFFVVFQDGGSSIVLPAMKAGCAQWQIIPYGRLSQILGAALRRRENFDRGIIA